jgi:hypothetical protein
MMPEPPIEESFVAYLDILGTKDLVSHGKFSDAHALDFTGAAVAAAAKFQSARFAAFSDCVILSTPAARPLDLVGILCFLFGNWFSDGILVRGGVAVGEIQWVDEKTDPTFHKLKNFSFARVYGKALSEAVEIERSSGPGVLPFAADAVADRFEDTAPRSVLRLSSNVLRCFEWKDHDKWTGFLGIYLAHTDSSEARKHIRSTQRVLELFRKLNPE